VETVREPARETPVVETCDLCVIGGGCTGVFAAVAAARRGLRVSLIENNGFFGGVATAAMVNIWHSLFDTRFERQVIGGLTWEIVRRLARRDAVKVIKRTADTHALHILEDLPADGSPPRDNLVLNTEELKIELDELVREAGIRPFLHARFVAVVHKNGRPAAAVIEDKSGRRAIRARLFLDASGDGDFIRAAALPWTKGDHLQPPTTCARIIGLQTILRRTPGFDLKAAIFDPRRRGTLPPGFVWSALVPGSEEQTLVAGTRVTGADCSDADQLTAAEIEGRRQVRCICDILRRHASAGKGVALAALPAHIGVRETCKAECRHRLTGEELLSGRRFPDAIANGTYPVDIHHADKPGITWRHLDGTETWFPQRGEPRHGRWREPCDDEPTFYQIPYRALVATGADNVLVCGRLIDTDREAYGATRVMVNCNQTGEAAGAAAALALKAGVGVGHVDADDLRKALADGGAVII